MDAGQTARGYHLLTADRGFAIGSGWLSHLLAPGFRRLIDAIDRGLVSGRIEASFPDGTTRTVGGHAPGPVAIVRIVRWRALVRLATSGSVGWYRAWADGDWESPDPVPLFDLFMRNRLTLGQTARSRGFARLLNRLQHLRRRNDSEGARRNIEFHYDLGNDFYTPWLDATMTYSSARFATPLDEAESLEAAQHRKIRDLLDRLGTRPGDRLLEIGCGWGTLAAIAASEYGLQVTGITLSAEQKAHAEAMLRSRGLSDQVTIELRDYRDVTERFDAVVSVEMVEAVGMDYWPAYAAAVARALKPGARAAIQMIAMAEDSFESYAANADFIQTYIFPGGMLMSEPRFRTLAEAEGLAWSERIGFGLDYAETLRRWRVAFDAAAEADRLPRGFHPRFIDLWRYYLMYCEGGFRGGGIDVLQVTLTKAR